MECLARHGDKPCKPLSQGEPVVQGQPVSPKVEKEKVNLISFEWSGEALSLFQTHTIYTCGNPANNSKRSAFRHGLGNLENRLVTEKIL